MAAAIFNNIVYLDKKFNLLPPETKIEDVQDTIVIKKYKFNRNYGKVSKDYAQHYTIVKGETSFDFNQKFFEEFKKHGELDADKIIEEAKKKSPGKVKLGLKNPGTKFAREFSLIFGILFLIAAPVAFFLLTTEKNFSGQIKEYNKNEEVKLGDFVKTNAILIDGYQVEVTTTKTNYGVELSKNTSKGNTYFLSAHDLENNQTYIIRYSAGSDLARRIEGNKEEYEFKDIRGEVKPLSAIEDLDQSEQVMDYFNKVLKEESLKGLELPVYLIDNRVTQSTLAPVILIVGFFALSSLISIVCAFIAHRKFNAKVRKDVLDIVRGDDNSPLI